MADWRAPKWSSFTPLLVKDAQMKDSQINTKYTPGLLGFAATLWCVWVADDNTLKYSLFQNDPDAAPVEQPTISSQRVWTSTKAVGAETVSSSPALAATGTTVHMVFANTDGYLVHLQYVVDPAGSYWGRRTGLAARSVESPCLASYQGALHCIWKSPDTNKLLYSIWEPKMGWTLPTVVNIPETTGQMALFELEGHLQLLSKDKTTQEIKGYLCDASNTWVAVNQQVFPDPKPKSTYGVTAVSVDGMAYMVYVNDTKVSTKKYSANRWQAVQNDLAVASKTPGIAVLDNEVTCVFPDVNNKLQWMTRKAVEVPAMSNWMSAIDGPILISNLTIPGTHDSTSETDVPYARTQNTSITEQLFSGIRYFDIRAGYIKDMSWLTARGSYALDPAVIQRLGDALCAFHGGVLIRDELTNNPLTLQEVFDQIYRYLNNHSQEGVIIQLKQDPNNKDPVNITKFSQDARTLIDGQGTQSLNKAQRNRWMTDASIPTMQNFRGRIQLVRRFELPKGLTSYGIDAWGPDWLDSNVSTIPRPPASPARIQIQDVWQFSTTPFLQTAMKAKFAAIVTHLKKAVADTDKNALYLNFASANGIPFNSPSELALDFYRSRGPHDFEGSDPEYLDQGREGINKKIATYFIDTVKVSGRYGVILLDFPERPSELVLALVKTNADKFRKA